MIILNSVDKFYNKGKSNEIHVIKDVSLELPDKGLIALYGKSGSGKTTLLNTIGGLTSIDGGHIYIDEDVVNPNNDELRSVYVGYIFQNNNLNLSKTVRENIEESLRIAGMRDESEIFNRVAIAIKNVGLEKYENKKASLLSGGQQQRVAVARAIVKCPEILLADEPTGNLDSENAEIVMDLIKHYSEDHLVILVTHDKKLIDNYCDQIVGICDGKIGTIEQNKLHNRETIRNKSIYLDELDRHVIATEFGEMDYYGDYPEKLIHCTIVNYKGRIYLRPDSDNIEIISDESKWILTEKKSEPTKKISYEKIDELDKTILKKGGKIFNLKSSILSAHNTIWGKNKTNKWSYIALFLIAVVMIGITAFYGTAIKKIFDMRDANNSSTFYAYIPDAHIELPQLQQVDSEENGCDEILIEKSLARGDFTFWISMPRLLNDEKADEDILSGHASVFSENLLLQRNILMGDKDFSSATDIVISQKVADSLLNNSNHSYINDYADFLGMQLNIGMMSDNFRVIGICDSNEYILFMSEKYIAKKRYRDFFNVSIEEAEYYGMDVEPGHVIIRTTDEQEDSTKGDIIKINGHELIVSKVQNISYSYDDWLWDNGLKKDYNFSGERIFEQTDEYYSDLKQYADYCKSNKASVLYDKILDNIARGDVIARSYYIVEHTGVEDYYFAKCFKDENGYYPNTDELQQSKDHYRNIYEIVKDDEQYDFEYVLNAEDYYSFYRDLGESKGFLLNEDVDGENECYAVMHSINPEKTERWLKNYAENNRFGNEYMREGILTPKMLYEEELSYYKAEFILQATVVLVIFILLFLCVYMIMKSYTARQVNTIGIYRCLGVKKSNIIFNTIIEKFVICAYTIGFAFILSSVILWEMQKSILGDIVSKNIYYPVWLGIVMAATALLVCQLLGLIPVLRILKKNPSDILSQYDA